MKQASATGAACGAGGAIASLGDFTLRSEPPAVQEWQSQTLWPGSSISGNSSEPMVNLKKALITHPVQFTMPYFVLSLAWPEVLSGHSATLQEIILQ